MKLNKIYEPAGNSQITDPQRRRVKYERNGTVYSGSGRLGIPSPIYPSVLKLEEISTWIRSGENIMPGFPHFTDDEVASVAKYMASNMIETDAQAEVNTSV